MPNPRVANCIFCDDIRVELGNKISLIGIYGTDMLFAASPPVTILKLGVVAWLISDIDDRPTSLTIRILMPPARTEVAKFEPDVSQLAIPSESDDLSKGSVRFMTAISLINISEPGFIEVVIDTERETFRAGRLKIRFNVSLEEMGLPSVPPFN